MAYSTTRLTLQFEADGFATWLDEALQPAFEPVSGAGDSRVVVDRAADQPIEPEAGEPLGELPCFLFDREVVSLPAWRVDDRIEVADANYGARYVFDAAHVEVHANGAWPRVRVAALRMVRELALSRVLSDGHCLRLHASSFARGGRVALLAGEKEAGKTTLLAFLAASTDACVVSNDCTLLLPPRNGETWRARAVPISVSVRAQTIESFPALFRRMPAVARPSHLTMAELEEARRRHGVMTPSGRFVLSTRQFALAMGSSLSSGGDVATIAFPTVDPAMSDFSVRELGPEESERRLMAARYGIREPHVGRTVVEQFLGSGREPSADAHAVRRLRDDVRCVELRVGPRMLGNPHVADALLSALLGA